jgi:hypothetical protein
MSNLSEEGNTVNCLFVKSNMWFVDYLETVYNINCVLNVVFAITAVIGNFMVLYAIINTPALHKPSNYLICNLALTDLATGLLVQPLYVIYKVSEMNGHVSVSCYCGVVVNMLANLFSGMSFITVTCISIDRYLALSLHLRYVAIVTTQRVTKAIVLFWIVDIFFVTFYPWKVSISLGFGVFGLFLCLIISSYTFVKIYQIVRKHQKQVNDITNASNMVHDNRISFHGLNLSKYRKSVLTMGYVYIILVICYFPYMTTLVSRLLIGLTKEYKLSLNVTTTIIYVNSSINPLVYCFRLKDFGNAIMKILRKKRLRDENSRTFNSIPRNKNGQGSFHVSHLTSNL